MEPILKTIGLTKNFGGVTAVDSMDFELKPGIIMGLVGPNGSGKSTFLNLLTGFYIQDSGEIYLGKEEISNLPTHKRVRLGISRTFQHTRLFENLTVLENVMSGRIYSSKSSWACRLIKVGKGVDDYRDNRKKALEVLKMMGLESIKDHNVTKVPYGQQRFLEIARSLVNDPRLLLLDEPAAGMTSLEIESLKELLFALRKNGLTTIIIEHNTALVSELANEMTVLNFGKKICEGSCKYVLNDPTVIEAYLGGDDQIA